MNFHGNWVDLVIIATLGLFIFDAFGRPFILELLDLISFMAALVTSLRYYNLLALIFEKNFNIPHGLSLVLGFMATWSFTEAVFFSLVRLTLPRLKLPDIPGSQNFSAIPALFKGVIFTALVLVLVTTFPLQPKLKQAVNQSTIGNFILQYTYQLESPLKQILGGVTNDTLTFLTVEPQANESIDLGFKTNNFTINESEEFAMIDLVNKERTSRGIQALTFDPKLREIAREHSEDMFLRGYFSHYSPEGETVADRARKAGIDYLVIGENLAYAPTLVLAHQGLMNSHGHRANILSTDYHKIGIGIADGGDYGQMFTQDFEN